MPLFDMMNGFMRGRAMRQGVPGFAPGGPPPGQGMPGGDWQPDIPQDWPGETPPGQWPGRPGRMPGGGGGGIPRSPYQPPPPPGRVMPGPAPEPEVTTQPRRRIRY